MGYIGQLPQRLEALPAQETGTGAPPEPGGPRADELPVLLPTDGRPVTITLRPEPANGTDPE